MDQTSPQPEQALDPADPYRRYEQTFPTLTREQIDHVSAFGQVEQIARHTLLFRRDDRAGAGLCEPYRRG